MIAYSPGQILVLAILALLSVVVFLTGIHNDIKRHEDRESQRQLMREIRRQASGKGRDDHN